MGSRGPSSLAGAWGQRPQKEQNKAEEPEKTKPKKELRQLKKTLCILGGDLCGGEGVFVAAGGDGAEDVGEVGGFISARIFGGLWEVARDEEGSIGFDHQTVGGDALDELAKMTTTAFIADPTCDADP